MSLADLSARIYTVKSRKNIPFSTAFVTMIREDLALRYSMFNIVKSLTGSEVLAQVAESKYGFKTPLQKEEEKNEKKRMDRRKRFERFTANSLVTLNNKLNTLTALTQRNTILIENLYNDLGSFRNQRKFTKRDMNISAPKIPIRSRTVKFQIDQLKAELTALQMMTIGAKNTRALKKRAESEGGGGLLGAGAVGAGAAGAAVAGGLGGKGPGDEGPGDTPTPKEDDSGGMSLVRGLIDTLLLGSITRRGYRFLRRKYFPTPSAGTATPVTPKPTSTATRAPVLDERLKASGSQYRDPKTGRIAKRPPTPTPTATKPIGLASRAMGALGRLGALGSRLLGAPVQAAAFGGFAMYDILTGRTAGKIIKNYEEVMARFGLKFIKGPGGTTIGYEIDGVAYTPETLPQEYKNILDAIGPDKRAAAAAQAVIASDETTYRLLETESGRKLVLPPPPTEVSDPLIRAAIAGRVALDVSEPQIPGQQQVAVSTPTRAAEPPVPAPQRSAPTAPTSATSSSVAPVSPPVASSAPVNVSGIPIDFAAYAKKIGMLESSGDYSAVNTLGYLGKYQFGALALQDLGLVKKGTTLKGLDNPKNWNIEGGKQAFLSNAKLQEQTFIKYTTMNFRTLQRIGVLNVESPPDQVAGFLAASHLLGPGGARDLMRGKVSTDAYGTKSSKYYVAGIETQRTYLAAITTPPALDYTAGASVSTPPPPMVASATPSASSMDAEISANAALAANKIVQSAVVALAGKVSDLDKLSQIDREFPAVRNASLA